MHIFLLAGKHEYSMMRWKIKWMPCIPYSNTLIPHVHCTHVCMSCRERERGGRERPSEFNGQICLVKALFIWNISIESTLKIFFNASSHRIFLLLLGSCKLCCLIYAQIFLTTWEVRHEIRQEILNDRLLYHTSDMRLRSDNNKKLRLPLSWLTQRHLQTLEVLGKCCII
jgi:hypothetical protein